MKKIIASVLAISLLGGGLLYALPGGSDPAKTEPAVKAATTWLATVDRGDYDGSWAEAASYFQSAVPQDQWVKQVRAVRAPLGKVLSRKVVGAKYTTSLPGAPDGEYVIIQIETSFENKKSSVETITPMLDGTRGWRVSGYFIR